MLVTSCGMAQNSAASTVPVMLINALAVDVGAVLNVVAAGV